MTTAPALDWLDATFYTRRRKAFDHAFRNQGLMITFKSVMDAGPSMHVCSGDYDDPLRWWL
jgi:hypothetical protein